MSDIIAMLNFENPMGFLHIAVSNYQIHAKSGLQLNCFKFVAAACIGWCLKGGSQQHRDSQWSKLLLLKQPRKMWVSHRANNWDLTIKPRWNIAMQNQWYIERNVSNEDIGLEYHMAKLFLLMYRPSVSSDLDQDTTLHFAVNPVAVLYGIALWGI